ncbi:MAG: pantoate--beta-alanine ligase [Thermodesulfovibrionia bacterium]|nr:pantoate--beta-alanine ligase [Thermodesulfovibrionia bacterium]
MQIIHQVKDMHSLSRLLRVSDQSIGFVPTMGALHEGHLSLIRRSKQENDVTVVSIYVNPLQFGKNEDFEKYPRQREKDIEMLSSVEADTVFIPEDNDMFGEHDTTFINIGEIGNILCGASRPGHFDGVANIVAKLFNIVSPDIAYFGQKDFQQSVIIKKLVRELKYGIDIIVCPTVREPDGLAMSSRNRYLTEAERKAAPLLYKALKHGRNLILSENINDPSSIKKELETMLKAEPLADLKYVEILNPESFVPVNKIELPVIICLAAAFGKARLIDNMVITKEAPSQNNCAL